MEATAGVAVVRGVSLPVPSSQPSRKEWRAVSEHSVRNADNELESSIWEKLKAISVSVANAKAPSSENSSH
ncbi:hypothetical protein F0562_025742 [Nyssa sinensis]|uniref:Uncharacterized protein n=1 Tax=Nyssa sinensis TaxID=561372 RepID=A0A5J5B9C5_9ASTE|nr:hypothetical protein F0562_025742 [Nyssa sinensis]